MSQFSIYISLFDVRSDCLWANLGAYGPELIGLLRAVRGGRKYLGGDVQ